MITKQLESYVRKYFAKHPDIKLVVVAGSVGKTSTKIASATPAISPSRPSNIACRYLVGSPVARLQPVVVTALRWIPLLYSLLIA